MIDALRDIQTLRGGEFMAACIDAVEQEGRRILRREEAASERGQAVDLDNLRQAALLAAAAEMLSAVRADGERSAAAGRTPVNAIIAAVIAGKQAFQQIDRGLPQKEAA
jgi:hypothetical protein